MVIGRVGWVPSHFAQCSEGQKLLGSILKGSPVSASQLATIINQNRTTVKSLAQSLSYLNIENTAVDWKGIQTILQNFTSLRRLEADEVHWQGLLVSLTNENVACRDCLPRNLPIKKINLSRHTYSLLEQLSQSLPNLEHLTIENYERSEAYLDGIDNIPLLQTFSLLSSLALKDVEMDQIYKFLEQGGGGNIKILR